jgi:hypothetical protein
VGATWNTLYPSLVKLNDDLEELGLIELNGEIVLEEEVGDV